MCDPADFVLALLRDAKTTDELAFAIGALTHYVGDNTGHSMATNPSVGLQFPKLEAKYGPLVTYDENPHAHVRTEFAFDVNEIAKHRFAPSRYLAHVGLKVATGLLARAFFETYGLHLSRVLGVKRQTGTIDGYRFAVRSFLPRIAYAENVLHKHRMPPDVQDEELLKLTQARSRSRNSRMDGISIVRPQGSERTPWPRLSTSCRSSDRWRCLPSKDLTTPRNRHM